MSFIYNATGELTKITNVETFDNTVENFISFPTIPASSGTGMASPNPVSFGQPSTKNSTTSKSTVSVARENVGGQQATIMPTTSKSTVSVARENVGGQQATIMPRFRGQDFLAINGSLVLDGAIKATNFIKSDGSNLKEIPILKNNYIMPKEIIYNADGTVQMKKLELAGGLKVGGYIIGNMPDTRNENKTPNEYRLKMGKGQIKEFKSASTIGLNISGVNYGVLTTTVPWPDNSGGNVFQNFEASYGGFRHIAKRNESSGSSWTPWAIMKIGNKN